MYDSLSRLLWADNKESGVTCYGTGDGTTAGCNSDGYDANGNLQFKTDASGLAISYQYDALNRLSSKTAPDGIDNTKYTYTYDQGTNGIGRLFKEENPQWSGTQFAYDTMGRVIGTSAFMYLAPPNGFWQNGMGVLYDLAGNVKQLTYPDGRIVKQEWNGAGRLQSVSDITGGATNSYVSGLTYWPSGTMNMATYGNGVTQSTQVNNRLQPCHQQASTSVLPANPNGANLLDRQLFYSAYAPVETNCLTASGNTGNIWQVLEGNGTGQSFAYDSLNRLTSAYAVNRPAASAYNQSFAYDSFGNMLPQDNLHTTLNYSIGAATNRLLLNGTDFQYDAPGRLIQTPNPLGGSHILGYTAEGYLRRIDNYQTGSYLYNGNGERTLAVRNDNGGGNRVGERFVYLNGQIMASIDDVTGVWSDNIYANGQMAARAQSESTQIRFKGTNCTGCNGGLQRWAYYLPFNNYTVQPGDRIAWRQMQSGAAVPRGGIVLRFTDGTYPNWVTNDQNGEVINSLSVQTSGWRGWWI